MRLYRNGALPYQVGTDPFGEYVVAVGHFNANTKQDLFTIAGAAILRPNRKTSALT